MNRISWIYLNRPFSSAIHFKTPDIKGWQKLLKNQILIEHDLVCPSRMSLMNYLLKNKLSHSDFDTSNNALLPLGWHFLLFPPKFSESELSPDGYDSFWSPPSPHTRRMWAGGSFIYNVKNPLRINDIVTQKTTIDSISFKNNNTAIFVCLNKEISNMNGFSMTEKRCLVYLTPKFDLSDDHQKRQGVLVKKETFKDGFTDTFDPTMISLFRYSALTHNSHLIHYSQKYATQVEGWPDCLVHGPLTGTLLLDLLQHNIPSTHKVKSFDYRAISPLVVGNQIQLLGRLGGIQDGDVDCSLMALNNRGYLAMKGTASLICFPIG